MHPNAINVDSYATQHVQSACVFPTYGALCSRVHLYLAMSDRPRAAPRRNLAILGGERVVRVNLCCGTPHVAPRVRHTQPYTHRHALTVHHHIRSTAPFSLPHLPRAPIGCSPRARDTQAARIRLLSTTIRSRTCSAILRLQKDRLVRVRTWGACLRLAGSASHSPSRHARAN
jgi:hypothetical protein